MDVEEEAAVYLTVTSLNCRRKEEEETVENNKSQIRISSRGWRGSDEIKPCSRQAERRPLGESSAYQQAGSCGDIIIIIIISFQEAEMQLHLNIGLKKCSFEDLAKMYVYFL